jgi:O-antigen/teichoic acid export membrane protein
MLRFGELKKTLLALSPFLMLIFFIKGIEFVDKFLIGKQLGLAETGIYSFLFSMASVLGVFVISGFYIIYLPQLIESFKNNKSSFKKVFLKFSLLTFGSSLVMAILIIFISPYVFLLIEKDIMLEHMNLLYLLLFGFVLHNISLIPHVFLYVCHDEKRISLIMGGAFVVNLTLNLILITDLGINGAAYSFVATYLAILLFKSLRAIIKWRKLAV